MTRPTPVGPVMGNNGYGNGQVRGTGGAVRTETANPVRNTPGVPSRNGVGVPGSPDARPHEASVSNRPISSNPYGRPGQPASIAERRAAPTDVLHRGVEEGPRGPRVINTSSGPMRVDHRPGATIAERQISNRPGFYRRTEFPERGGRPVAYVSREYHYGPYHYLRPVPAVIYSPAFYTWSFARPVPYAWGWGGQPWYVAYGGSFTPYQTYPSMDYWMTDYVISQNLQEAYADNAQNAGGGVVGSAPGQAVAAGPPPQIPEDVKQQIEAEVRAELQQQQQLAAQGPNNVAPPASANEPDSVPDALKPEHTTFFVSAQLQTQVDGRNCTLRRGDVIKRTSGMLSDGTVTASITVSHSAECPQGATTQIAFNDLNDMENDFQQHITQGLQVAAANIGKGLPNGLSPNPTTVPAGQTGPDLMPQAQ